MNKYLEKIAANYETATEEELDKSESRRKRNATIGGATVGAAVGAYGAKLSHKPGTPFKGHLLKNVGITSALFGGIGRLMASEVNPQGVSRAK